MATNGLFREVTKTVDPPLGKVWPKFTGRALAFKSVMSNPDKSSVTNFELDQEDGGALRVQCQMRAIVEDGKPVAVLGFCETATSHKIGNALGQETSKNFQTAMEAAHVIAMTMDPQLGHVTVSDSFQRLIGNMPTADGATLKHLSDWAHPDDVEKIMPWFDALARGDIRRLDCDLRLYSSDAGWVWSNIKAKLRHRDELGLPPVICGCAVDISDYKKNEIRLEAAFEAAETARESAEEMRQNANQLRDRFEMAARNGKIGPFTFCPQTGDGWMMDESYEMMGYAPGEFVPDQPAREQLIHPDDIDRVRKNITALIEGEVEQYDQITRQRHKDGSYHWYRSIATMVDRSAEGLPPLVAGVSSNVDSQKEAEFQLARALSTARKANDRFNRLADNSPTALYEVIRRGKDRLDMQYFTSKLPQMVGMPAEAIRKDALQIYANFDSNDRDALFDAAFESRKTGEPFQVTSRCHHPERGVVWLQVASIPKTLPDGGTLHYASITDVTQRMQAELRAEAAAQAAQTAKDHLKRLADNAPVAIYEVVLTPDGEIRMPYFTARTPGFFGVTAQELAADPTITQRHMVQEDVQRLLEEIEVAHATLSPLQIEVRIQHPEDGLIWLQIASIPHRREDGCIHSIASVTDITQRMQAETRAQEAMEQARTAHDRLNHLTDNAPTALFEVRKTEDGGRRFAYFSAKLPGLFGVSEEAMYKDLENVFEHVLPEDKADFDEKSAIATRKRKYYETHLRIQHPSRGMRWVRLESQPAEAPGNELVRYGSVADVTDLVEAQARALQAAEASLAANDRLNRLAENTPIGLFELRRSAEGKDSILYCNEKQAELRGVSVEKLMEDPMHGVDQLHPDDQEHFLAELARSEKELNTFEAQFRVLHPERGTIWLLARSAPRRGTDGSTTWYGSTTDITEQVATAQRAAEATQELRESHALMNSIADAAPVGLYQTTSLATPPTKYTYTSARFDQIFGVADVPTDQKYQMARQRIHPDDIERIALLSRASLEARQNWTDRMRIQHPELGDRWISVSAVTRDQDDGRAVHVGAVVDVTQDMKREEELREAHALAETMRAEVEVQAMHDPLTGLANRRSFDLELATRFAQAAEGKTFNDRVLGLIRIDGDRFKYINDTFGHEAGDAVLQRISDVMRHEAQLGDFPARVGGDEFSILLAHRTFQDDAAELVRRIQAALAEPLVFDGRRCLIQASFGVAFVDASKENAVDLLAFADAALYRAKDKGRNRMEFFTPDLRDAIFETRRVASELQEALANDQFEPFFQPQVDISTGKLFGVEMLLRWRHPEQGVLTPFHFLNVAEQLRIVPDLDRIMMQKTRDYLRLFRERGIHIPKVSFNVSSGRMQDADVVESARDLLNDGVTLTFELLESTLVEEEGDVFRFHLDQLRELGIEIEIDDFGSGHASIIALMTIAPNALKIDRRIISPVAHDPRARKMVRAIIEIAETLNINTIAEGVEEDSQISVLKGLGCNIVQGFFFSRPLSFDDFGVWLQDGGWITPNEPISGSQGG